MTDRLPSTPHFIISQEIPDALDKHSLQLSQKRRACGARTERAPNHMGRGRAFGRKADEVSARGNGATLLGHDVGRVGQRGEMGQQRACLVLVGRCLPYSSPTGTRRVHLRWHKRKTEANTTKSNGRHSRLGVLYIVRLYCRGH